MEFIKEKTDIEKLINYLNDKYEDKKESEVTKFSTVDPVYKWTNEKMSLYPKDDLEGKKVLTITSSGDHTLDAILKGATNIDCIDINIFCKYYSAFKIAMIKKYDYDDFFKNMNLITMEITDAFLIDALNDINRYLTDEEFAFWSAYLKYKTSSEPDFFHVFPIDFSCNEYRFKEVYDNLKERVDGVKINYYDVDIVDAPNVLNGNKYDYIYLSNILERICKVKTREEIIEKIINILNDNGSIYSYFLGMNNDKLKFIFEKPSNMISDKFDFKYYCDYEDENTCDRGIIQMIMK